VFAAAIDELSERGYDDVSIETIAARAGVHKTTLYRRWHSKAELIAHALAGSAQSLIPVPDTGRAETDFRDLARSVQDVLSSPRGAAITRALLAGSATSAEIHQEIRHLMQDYWAARLAAISVIIDRAIARGELPPGTDPEAAMRAVAAPLYYQLLVTLEPITKPAADQAAAAALAAARAHVFTPAQASGGELAVPGRLRASNILQTRGGRGQR
jgi:AcrR family transcriptional regulator